MNLTAVIMTLLELQTDPSVSLETKKAIAQSGNLPGTGQIIYCHFPLLKFDLKIKIVFCLLWFRVYLSH